MRLNRNLLHAVVDRIPFHSLEAGVFDHGDEFLFGHFYLAVFNGVAFGELAAVNKNQSLQPVHFFGLTLMRVILPPSNKKSILSYSNRLHLLFPDSSAKSFGGLP